MKKMYLTPMTVFMIMFTLMSATQAQSPQEILNQYILELQKNPNDYALREKIIRFVQTTKPAPAIPVEAEKYEGRAEFAFKNAKSEADFLDAAKEYEKALLVAPWAPAYYFNQGLAYEKARKLKESKQSFEFYLLAAPDAKDAREVRKRIAGLEYAQEKASKESSPVAIAAKKQNEYETWLKKINGARYITDWSTRYQAGITTLDVQGSNIIKGIICYRGCDEAGNIYAGRGWHKQREMPLKGREFNDTGGCISGGRVVDRVFEGKISEDGNSATLEDCIGTNYYRRER